MSEEAIRYEAAEGVATITLDRPESKNMFTAGVGDEVWEAFDRARRSDDVRVIVLAGAGSVFCGGVDPAVVGIPEERERIATSKFFQQFPRAVFECPKPTICAIGGHAMGVGVTMTLAFDMRIVGDDVRLTMPFTKLNMIAWFGGTWLLPRLLGRSKALEILYTGRPVLGAEAAAIGLANLAVARDEVNATAHDMAVSIADAEGVVLEYCKRSIDENADRTLPDALVHELALFDELQARRQDRAAP